MDLHTISAVTAARSRADLADLGPGDAVLAGGTWLYSEPQDHLTRLVELSTLGWPALTVHADGSMPGLEIAATCTIADFARFDGPPGWCSRPLFRQCSDALLASFKVWNFATVGGNVCLSFPAGAMTSLLAALDAQCLVWRPDGSGYRLPIVDFVTGNARNVLQQGEVLRSLHLADSALRSRTAFRKIALSPLGRSGAVIIGRLSPEAHFVLTVSASTVRPILLRFDRIPSSAELAAEIARIEAELWFSDAHGSPDWRRAVSGELAEEVRAELATDGVVAR